MRKFIKSISAAVAVTAVALTTLTAPAHATPPTPRTELIEGCSWVDGSETDAPMQRCMVPSTANGRDIPVDVIRSLTPASPHVVQMLDGLAPNSPRNGWVEPFAGDLRSNVDGVDATFVAPVAPDYSFYMDFSRPRDGEVIMMETFMTKELPAWLASIGVTNGGYGTTGAMGLSAGAFAAVNLAAASPSLYSGVYALSGFYDLNSVAERKVIEAAGFQAGKDWTALWGTYWQNPRLWQEHNPVNIIDRVTAPVILSSSTGPANLFGEDPATLPAAVLQGGPLEAGSAKSTTALESAAFLRGKRDVETRWKVVGAHTWHTWRTAAYNDGGFDRFLTVMGVPTSA